MGKISAGTMMGSKSVYFKQGVFIDRNKFCSDIKKTARDSKKPIPVILREFFAKEAFTKEEMGLFALYTSANADLVDAAVTLIHALELTEKNAPSLNILVTYFGARPRDSVIWGFSFNIDTALNWKLGTIMPSSKEALENI